MTSEGRQVSYDSASSYSSSCSFSKVLVKYEGEYEYEQEAESLPKLLEWYVHTCEAGQRLPTSQKVEVQNTTFALDRTDQKSDALCVVPMVCLLQALKVVTLPSVDQDQGHKNEPIIFGNRCILRPFAAGHARGLWGLYRSRSRRPSAYRRARAARWAARLASAQTAAGRSAPALISYLYSS